ncbi:MAG: hypothetical protein AAGJ91_17075 [Pseudomonadota bacterium]
MGALFDIIGYLAKPLFLAVVALVVLGFVDAGQTSASGTSVGFECQGFTNDPDWNRIICQYHPGRLLNRPVSELVPGFGTDG